MGLLESALGRPENTALYEEGISVFVLAAKYVHGIVANHPFVDGNKRTGFIVGYVFLSINGYNLVATEDEVVHEVVSLAASQTDELHFAKWLATNVVSQS